MLKIIITLIWLLLLSSLAPLKASYWECPHQQIKTSFIRYIKNTKQYLYLKINRLNDIDIKKALLSIKDKNVVLLLDKSEEYNHSYDALIDAGINVKLDKYPVSNSMLALRDEEVCWMPQKISILLILIIR